MHRFPVGVSQAQQTLDLGSGPSTVAACVLSFEDAVFILLSDNGKIGQLISIASTQGSLTVDEIDSSHEFDMLPDTDLTPNWLLGGSDSSRSDVAGLLSVQIASAIRKRQEIPRKMLFGMSLTKSDLLSADHEDTKASTGNEALVQLVGLVVRAYDGL